MKKVIFLFTILYSISTLGQSLSVFNADPTKYPLITASFLAFDSKKNQLTDLLPNDFLVLENGIQRKVISVRCSESTIIEPISAVLAIDISGSMNGAGIKVAKDAAKEFVNGLAVGVSDCAITSFNDQSFLNQDMTTDSKKLIKAIDKLRAGGSTDYMPAFTNEYNGCLSIAKRGNNNRIVIFLTDGQPNNPPQEDKIISMALKNKISIYSVVIGMNCPKCLKNISAATGGLYFENVNSSKQAKQIYLQILHLTQDRRPCQIEWESDNACSDAPISTKFTVIMNKSFDSLKYQPPLGKISKLIITPQTIKYFNCPPGIKKDTTIRVKAVNSKFTIKNISFTEPNFIIKPSTFIINAGDSIDLNLSFIPKDSENVFSEINFETDICPAVSYIGSSYTKKKVVTKTLKLIRPNGGEAFVAGIDTLINWEGISPEDNVKLEYSTDSGLNWETITESAKGLSYKWHVPKTPSDSCLARVTYIPAFPCDVGDVVVFDQTWMGCNLDVDHYRNGDIIPEVQDPQEWINLTTGAWCYYNNDPDYGKIFGKIYNWYALNDPRGLAPAGWRISESADWIKLMNNLAGWKLAGGKIKSTGTIANSDGMWNGNNDGATNESGLTAFPGGLRNIGGTFSGMNNYGFWWVPGGLHNKGDLFYLYSGSSELFHDQYLKYCGLSVRCIK